MGSPEIRSDTPSHALFSPEGVRLDLPIAGPALRMIAYAIDFVLIFFLNVFLIVGLIMSFALGKWADRLFGPFAEASKGGHPNPQQFGTALGIMIAIFVLGQFVVEFGYFIFWEMVSNGRSVGKGAMGLRVVRRSGMPIDLRNSVIRNVVRIADMLPGNYLVGLIAILISPSGERLGDHAAGTIVIRLDRPESAAEIDTSAIAPTLSLSRQQLERIGPPELQLIRATLRRIATLPPELGRPLLDEVAETVRARLELGELPGGDKLAFLRDVLAVAERYTRDRPGNAVV